MQNGDERTFAEKTLSKLERTSKQQERRSVKFCKDVAADNQHPEQATAKKLFAEWGEIQRRTCASPKEQQNKTKDEKALVKRMEKLRKQDQ
jgi:hypothetical protein